MARDVFDTFATQAGLVHDVTDTGRWAQIVFGFFQAEAKMESKTAVCPYFCLYTNHSCGEAPDARWLLPFPMQSVWRCINLLETSSCSRVQELCESRGGRPGLPSLISLRFLWT